MLIFLMILLECCSYVGFCIVNKFLVSFFTSVFSYIMFQLHNLWLLHFKAIYMLPLYRRNHALGIKNRHFRCMGDF